MMRTLLAALALACGLGLAACGTASNIASATPQTQPPPAVQTTPPPAATPSNAGPLSYGAGYAAGILYNPNASSNTPTQQCAVWASTFAQENTPVPGPGSSWFTGCLAGARNWDK